MPKIKKSINLLIFVIIFFSFLQLQIGKCNLKSFIFMTIDDLHLNSDQQFNVFKTFLARGSSDYAEDQERRMTIGNLLPLSKWGME